MKKREMFLFAALMIALVATMGLMPRNLAAQQSGMKQSGGTGINVLTEREKREGWKLLFDGKTTEGWRGAYREKFPESGWAVMDGTLVSVNTGGGESQAGGDIVTVDEYGSFDLRFEWQISEGGNSGVKYFVEEQSPKPKGSAIGCEYQLLDDVKFLGVAEGKIPEKQKTAALYDVFPARNNVLNPIGAWNQSRIIVRGKRVEHWLNGRKVLEYERGSEAFRTAVADSKFKNHPGFGLAAKGRILLQDHGHRAAFRNIKIRVLTGRYRH
ncbi:MAG: DUF1080 domain-containing protein [Acidobacteria bacterium]|nr:DUF1080 domain-containing protein [Acidobacteriota bacterium]